MEVHIGCCGFPVARKIYYEAFGLAEVQQTFFQPPRIRTAARWREQAPVGFTFNIRAWQLITHEPSSPTYRRLARPVPEDLRDRYGSFKSTEEVMASWETTAEIARTLDTQWIVFQCPASFTPTSGHKENMRRFFRSIDRSSFRFAWEPGGVWEEDDVDRLCAELDLVRCVDPLISATAEGTARYFRLHGRRGFRQRYGEDDFYRLLDFCEGPAPTFVLFNNVSMFDDARAFQRFLRTQ